MITYITPVFSKSSTVSKLLQDIKSVCKNSQSDEGDDCFSQSNIKSNIRFEKQFSSKKFKLQKKQGKEGKTKTSEFTIKP